MVHVLLRYPETITNLSFIHVSTFPLEFCAGSEKREKTDRIPVHRRNRNQRDGRQVNVFNAIQDGAFTDMFISNRNRNSIENLPQWRKHTDSERLTFESIEA